MAVHWSVIGETLNGTTVALNITPVKRPSITLARKNLRQIVAEWLERGMRQSGLTQTALADTAGVARATVNRLAREKQDGEAATIKRLARAMNYPFPDIDAEFPAESESNAKRYKAGPGGLASERSVAEPSGMPYGGAGQKKEGLPSRPADADLIEEITLRPGEFTRRLQSTAADVGLEAVLAWLDDVEGILRERGYDFKRYLAQLRQDLRARGAAAGGRDP